MSKTFFNTLNYSIGNEDASLEWSMLPKNTHHVLAVTGSGSRVIPLLAKNPRYITCVDSSKKQLSFAEMRIASLKELNHKEFLAYWGYPSYSMSPSERQVVFNNLSLSHQTREICSMLFNDNHWETLLYAGKWEQTFMKLSMINRIIIGKKGLGIFTCKSKEEQTNYLETKFPKRAWSFSLFLLGNATVFNALLYKGNFPKKNISNSLHSFYKEKFDYLFKQDLVRKNYFLQLLFFGTLQFPEGLPMECDLDIFLKAKRGLESAKIVYVHGDAVEEAERTPSLISFLSFSDTPSYFNPPREQEFLQIIKNNISPQGIVVNRYYLRIPEKLNTDGFINVTKNYEKVMRKEKIQMYSYGIYKKR